MCAYTRQRRSTERTAANQRQILTEVSAAEAVAIATVSIVAVAMAISDACILHHRKQLVRDKYTSNTEQFQQPGCCYSNVTMAVVATVITDDKTQHCIPRKSGRDKVASKY